MFLKHKLRSSYNIEASTVWIISKLHSSTCRAPEEHLQKQKKNS